MTSAAKGRSSEASSLWIGGAGVHQFVTSPRASSDRAHDRFYVGPRPIETGKICVLEPEYECEVRTGEKDLVRALVIVAHPELKVRHTVVWGCQAQAERAAMLSTRE